MVSLIHCGCLAAYPDLFQNRESSFVYDLEDAAGDEVPPSSIADGFQCFDQASIGVEAAARAWGNSGAEYALLKYRFSLERDWFTPHSAAPRHRDIFAYKYDDPRSQVNAAFAIVAAYSVIEELGLEVRSSQKKPRFLKDSGNAWNPEVLDDINARLEAAGIPADSTVGWLWRGSRTDVEREIDPKLGKQAEWNRRFGTRDRMLALADAIHYVSWLRNYIAAHKLRAIATEVSPYEVHNAQMVARRVLLGFLGLWNRLVSG